MESKKLLTHLDEETLTAGLFGGLASATALFAECYGSGIQGQVRECSWGMFKKSKPKGTKSVDGKLEPATHEAQSGADFALVLWQTQDEALVALFQAKKPEATDNGALSVHRKANATTGHAQLIVFAAMCWMMRDRTMAAPLYKSIHDALNEFERLSAIGRKALVDELSGGHYLIYESGEPVCIPLSAIDSGTIELELAKQRSSPIPRDLWHGKQTFPTLLRNGVQGVASGWLRMKRPQIEGLLPHLIDLMEVYEATEKGGAGLALQHASEQRGRVPARASTAAEALKLERIVQGKTSPAPSQKASRPGCAP